MRNFEDLIIWKDARTIANRIFKLLSKCNDFGFRDQIQRAAVSIMNNIAEGHESGTDALFIRYLNVAKGSCAEVKSMLYLCEDLGICSNEDATELRDLVQKEIMSIQKFISSINNKK